MKLYATLITLKLKNICKKFISAIPILNYTIRTIILHIYVYSIFHKSKTSTKSSGLSILLINHHFEQDIEAIIDANKIHKIKVADCKKLFGLSNYFFTTSAERNGLIPYDKIPMKTRLGYRQKARYIINHVRKYFPFDVMVLPSDSFFWIREVIVGLKELNIPTIVADKEGIISPYWFKAHSLEIKEKFPFISDRILVWSKRQKEFWIRAGAREECIEIVGQPRSDFFFNEYKWKTKKELNLSNERRVVLFFAYDINAYIPPELFEQGLSWKEMRAETHNVIKKLAREYPQINFIVKTHPQARNFSFVLNDLSGTTHNIKLMSGSLISNHLLANADIIVGFQTTALIEAMFFKVPVLYTFWTKSTEYFAEELIPFHKSGGVEVIHSANELEKKIKHYIEQPNVPISPKMIQSRIAFVNKYFYEANGRTGKRLLRAIENFLTIYNNTSSQIH